MALDGNMLKQRRLELKMTLQEVGAAVGVLRGTVQKWENGTIKTIRSDKIVELAKVLRIPLSEILGIADRENTEQEPETRVLTERQKVLREASKNLTDQEMDAVIAMISALKSTRRD